MNWRMVLIVSLGVNILLAAFALKRISPGDNPTLEEPDAEATSPPTPKVREVTQTVVLTNLLPAPDLEWPTWSDWVADDWGEMRTNLLAAGCPGVTVREILRASLQRAQFSEQQSVRAAVNGVFWDALARYGFDTETGPLKQTGDELEAIDHRYEELRNRVLQGLPSNRDLEDTHGKQRERERQFAHLEPDKQQAMASLEAEFERRRDALINGNQDGRGQLTPEGKAALTALTEAHRNQLAELMGPDAAAEWRLRTSGQADWAAQLRGLEVTTEEMRQIAEWKNLLPAQEPRSVGPGATSSEAEATINANIRELLGDERFELMQQANQQNGGTYVALFDIAERFELPSNVIQQGLEMQQTANAAANQIRANEQLTAAQRRDALRAVQQETRQAVESLLGAEAFYTYQRHGGEWITGLSALNAPR